MQTSQTLRFAGDVEIKQVKVVTSTGFFQDITNQIIGIQIFEDLLSPFITGTLIVKDSLDLINVMPFVGEEYLEMQINTPTLKTGNISGKFYIYKMTDRDMVGDKSVVYQLHFTSQDALLDLNKAISKTFSGKVSDIAKTLLTDKVNGMQVSKKYNIEETDNSTKYTSNFWSPLKNIVYLTNNAVSKGKTSDYIFFENRDGYNFTALSTLYKQVPLQDFVFDNYSRDDRAGGGNIKNLNEDYRRIESITIPEGFDYIDKIRSGMYGSRMYTHDITSKKVTSKNYDMLQDFKNNPHLNQYPSASSKVIYRYGSKIINETKYYNNFSNFGNSTNVDNVQQRLSLLKQAESTKIQIVVPGRMDYTVGRTVYVKLNKVQPTSKTDKSTLDNVFSGKYLISAINHFISREKHECSLELIKDSLLLNLDGKK
jgi:hypothetical protein